jgi:hypothetical protein
MDFQAAAQHLALTVDDDMDVASTMDVSDRPHPWNAFNDPSTDDMDPAAPGGPAPYNGTEPFGEPVTSNPEWLDPSTSNDERGRPVPFTPGANVDTTTLHNARRAAYEARNVRFR